MAARGGGGRRRLQANQLNREARFCPGLKEWAWVRDGEFPHCGVRCVDNSIQDIRLENAGLDGPIPESISDLGNLDTLDLTYNALRGNLPSSLATMTSLETFAIGTVDGVATDQLPSLSGALPDFCGGDIGGGHRRAQILMNGGGSSLRQLLVYSAPGITGAFPSLAGCASLELVHISSTGMTGPLPSTLFSDHPNLETVLIRNNMLSGAVPSIGLRDLQNLKTLDLSGNELSGDMPDLSGGRCPRLESLQLRVNSISGTISSLPRTLTHMDLSNNPIIGTLPEDFTQQEALVGLGLTTTMLEGPLRVPPNVEALYAADSAFDSLQPATPGGLCATPASQTLNCDLSKNEFTSCRASAEVSMQDIQCATACKLSCAPSPPPPAFSMGTAGCGRAPNYQPDAGRSSQTRTISVGGHTRTAPCIINLSRIRFSLLPSAPIIGVQLQPASVPLVEPLSMNL